MSKVSKTSANVDCESCQTKCSNILDLFVAQYPSPFSSAFARGRLNQILRCHRFRKVSFASSARNRENGVFKNFHSEERFRKVAISVTVFSGYVWTEGQKKLRF